MVSAAGTRAAGARKSAANARQQEPGQAEDHAPPGSSPRARASARTGKPSSSATPRRSRPNAFAPNGADAEEGREHEAGRPGATRRPPARRRGKGGRDPARPMKSVAFSAGSRQATRRSFSSSAPMGPGRRMRARLAASADRAPPERQLAAVDPAREERGRAPRATSGRRRGGRQRAGRRRTSSPARVDGRAHAPGEGRESEDVALAAPARGRRARNRPPAPESTRGQQAHREAQRRGRGRGRVVQSPVAGEPVQDEPGHLGGQE